MFNNPREPLVGSSNSMEDIPKTIVSPLLDRQEQHRSGRIVRASDRFIFLGKTIFDEHDLDPSSYNVAISN